MGWWSGVTVAWMCVGNRGGKAPAAKSRGSFSRTTNTAPKNYDCDENDCAPSRQGARPARQESAHGFNPKRRRACLLRRRTQQRQAPVWPLREGVATMRGRNTMRFSAPTREPPGGRPSRGAKLKGRGCTRQKDARNENRLGGTGAAKKAPSEQGATKAAGLGAEDAHSGAAPVERSGTRVAGQTKEAAVLRKGGNQKKRTSAQHFFYCRSLYPCAHQGRRKKRRRREHRFPPRFFALDVRWAMIL